MMREKARCKIVSTNLLNVKPTCCTRRTKAIPSMTKPGGWGISSTRVSFSRYRINLDFGAVAFAPKASASANGTGPNHFL